MVAIFLYKYSLLRWPN